jgi:hypothetical protein
MMVSSTGGLVRLSEHLSEVDVGRALVVVRDVTDDLPAGRVLHVSVRRRAPVSMPRSRQPRCA